MSRPRHLVVIGGSAGAIEALFPVLARLPDDFAAPIALALHRRTTLTSELAHVLDRHSNLEVVEPVGGEPLAAGRIYLAPRDHDLTIDRRGVLRLDRGPKQHHTRPAIDPLFESAATSFGRRVIGALLTGVMGDGTLGLVCVKKHGGVALAHDPREARFPSMPRNALLHDNVDLLFRIAALPDLLTSLVAGVRVDALKRSARDPAGGARNGWSSFDTERFLYSPN